MIGLKTMVSGTRRRYTEGGWNIDLTYICRNRIIVMSYPAATFIQSQYRNHYTDVRKFLDKYHYERYVVYNLSEQGYDSARFNGNVMNFPWQDHHAPPFHLLFELVDHMFQHLMKDPRNVVVIHCNSGKGRAGTACTCLLLYMGMFDNIAECARLFGSRRFTDKKGVS